MTQELLLKFYPPPATLNQGKILKRLIHDFADKRVLDLGSGQRRLHPNFTNLDIKPHPTVDIVADAHNLPFNNNEFDLVICQALLEHVQKPPGVVKEIHRVLKPQGLVYIEVPFLQGYHSDPTDYTRYTALGLETLMDDHFKKLESGVNIGPASTLAWILREIPAIIFNHEICYQITRALFGWLTFWIKYLDLILINRQHAFKIASGVYYLGQKV